MESRDILSRLNTSVCLRERLAAILGAVGVAVTDQEIFDIENQRNESLRSHGLLELDSRALEVLLTFIGQAPFFLAIMQLKQSVNLSSCTMLFAHRILPRSVIQSWLKKLPHLSNQARV